MPNTPNPAAAIRAVLLKTFQTFAPGVVLSLLAISAFMLFRGRGACL